MIKQITGSVTSMAGFSAGDMLQLKPGKYTSDLHFENLNGLTIDLGQGVTLDGAGLAIGKATNLIISGGKSAIIQNIKDSRGVVQITGKNTNCVISGFVVRNCYGNLQVNNGGCSFMKLNAAWMDFDGTAASAIVEGLNMTSFDIDGIGAAFMDGFDQTRNTLFGCTWYDFTVKNVPCVWGSGFFGYDGLRKKWRVSQLTGSTTEDKGLHYSIGTTSDEDIIFDASGKAVYWDRAHIVGCTAGNNAVTYKNVQKSNSTKYSIYDIRSQGYDNNGKADGSLKPFQTAAVSLYGKDLLADNQTGDWVAALVVAYQWLGLDMTFENLYRSRSLTSTDSGAVGGHHSVYKYDFGPLPTLKGTIVDDATAPPAVWPAAVTPIPVKPRSAVKIEYLKKGPYVFALSSSGQLSVTQDLGAASITYDDSSIQNL